MPSLRGVLRSKALPSTSRYCFAWFKIQYLSLTASRTIKAGSTFISAVGVELVLIVLTSGCMSTTADGVDGEYGNLKYVAARSREVEEAVAELRELDRVDYWKSFSIPV